MAEKTNKRSPVWYYFIEEKKGFFVKNAKKHLKRFFQGWRYHPKKMLLVEATKGRASAVHCRVNLNTSSLV